MTKSLYDYLLQNKKNTTFEVYTKIQLLDDDYEFLKNYLEKFIVVDFKGPTLYEGVDKDIILPKVKFYSDVYHFEITIRANITEEELKKEILEWYDSGNYHENEHLMKVVPKVNSLVDNDGVKQKNYVGNDYLDEFKKSINAPENIPVKLKYKNYEEKLNESKKVLNELNVVGEVLIDDFHSYINTLDKLAKKYEQSDKKDLKEFIQKEVNKITFSGSVEDKVKPFITDLAKKINDKNYSPNMRDVLGQYKEKEPEYKEEENKKGSYEKTIKPIRDIKRDRQEEQEKRIMKIDALRKIKVDKQYESIKK